MTVILCHKLAFLVVCHDFLQFIVHFCSQVLLIGSFNFNFNSQYVLLPLASCHTNNVMTVHFTFHKQQQTTSCDVIIVCVCCVTAVLGITKYNKLHLGFFCDEFFDRN